MQPNKKTHEWVGWLKALAFMSLLIGLLVGSCQIPRSAASSSLAPQNPEIGHSGWGQQGPAEARDWDSNSPHRFDATWRSSGKEHRFEADAVSDQGVDQPGGVEEAYVLGDELVQESSLPLMSLTCPSTLLSA